MTVFFTLRCGRVLTFPSNPPMANDSQGANSGSTGFCCALSVYMLLPKLPVQALQTGPYEDTISALHLYGILTRHATRRFITLLL